MQIVNALRTTEVGVTLQVSGFVISGVIISVERYYELQIKTFENPKLPPAANAMAQFFQPLLDATREENGRHDSDESHI